MCHRVKCRICGKATWAGCGNHIEQALAGVPTSARCQGHAREEVQHGGGRGRLFGRRRER